MRIFRTPPYRDIPELLDSTTGVDDHDLQTTLRDIRRANIFGLGTWVVKHHLEKLLAGRTGKLSVLDVATGSGDIPEELFRWARTRDVELTCVLTDISPEILSVARERINRVGFGSAASFAVCDAGRLPFPDASFDVVVCSLAFHHLNVRQAMSALREMARLSRVGFIINDVYRSQGAWYMAWLLVHLTTTNRLTRHDGPASVLRAFTPRELRRMASEVGVPVTVFKHPFWRMAVVGKAGG
ncbi:MAG: methyltransferase domain-containing protein [Chloroflexota bacterium]|nr:methyltransferase domain-containing protein [Chloroflexota bacterium]MDQ5865907.1 methyltransferase domain-containing protein [Chloroflexota bacterium]